MSRIIRILVDTEKKLPCHVMSVVSARSPVRVPLRLIRMEGEDMMKLFGLMEMTIGGKPQRVPGSMDRIAAPEGVKMNGLDVWQPGEYVELKMQHVIMSSRSGTYARTYDGDDGLSGYRRFRAVLVAQLPHDSPDELIADLPREIVEPAFTPARAPMHVARQLAKIAVSKEMFDALPFDFAAHVEVK